MRTFFVPPSPPKDLVQSIRAGISHVPSGGVLTPGILISRALRLAADRKAFNVLDVTRALHEELLERGWVVSDDDVDSV